MSSPDLLAVVAALIPLTFIVNWLIETLKDPDPGVRRSALKALAAFPEVPETTSAMVEAVDDKDVSVSYMAARLLHDRTGKNGIERTRKAWAEALK